MFGKDSNEALDEFARSLARELAARCSPEWIAESKGKKAETKLRKALDLLQRKATDYRRDNELGVYGKARIGNSFQWELKEMGYEAPLVEQATKGVILSLSRR